MEFDEVREYVPGDDVRTIDWNVTARIGDPFVKSFVEERELTVMLLVDLSASRPVRLAGAAQARDWRPRSRRCSRSARDPQQRPRRARPVHRPGRALRAAAEGPQPRAAGDRARSSRFEPARQRHRPRPRARLPDRVSRRRVGHFLLSDFLAERLRAFASAYPPPRPDPDLHRRPARGRAAEGRPAHPARSRDRPAGPGRYRQRGRAPAGSRAPRGGRPQPASVCSARSGSTRSRSRPINPTSSP